MHVCANEWWVVAAALDGSLRLFDRRRTATAPSAAASASASAAAKRQTNIPDNTESVVTYDGHCNTALMPWLRGTVAAHTRAAHAQTVWLGGTDSAVRAWDVGSGQLLWCGTAGSEEAESAAPSHTRSPAATTASASSSSSSSGWAAQVTQRRMVDPHTVPTALLWSGLFHLRPVRSALRRLCAACVCL
jgi:hypothetical protein